MSENKKKKQRKFPGKKIGTSRKGSSANKKDKNIFQWKQAGKTSIVWIAILISAILLSGLFTSRDKHEIRVEYPEYYEFLMSNIIDELKIIEREAYGKLVTPTETKLNNKVTVMVDRFVVTLPYDVDKAVIEEWDEYDLRYSFEEKKVDWKSYLLSMAPWLLLIAFWIFIMRRMQGGMGGRGIFNFGKSRAKLWTSDKPQTSFKDVAGCVEAKEELHEVINFLKHPKRYQKLGGKIPKGVLLLGPPGTGKTLLARAVAGEADVPFFSLSGADFVEMFVGVGASRVRDLFEQGKKHAPSIIFIDEIDAVGRHRGAGLGGGHDEREQTLNALLVEMDGFEDNQNVILLAATNRPDVLDTALLRPGRFDRQIVVDVPDLRGRIGILKVHTRKTPLDKDIDLETLARGTPGLVGADLANLVNEASLLAARKKRKKVCMEDFEDAKDKVMMGVERRSLILSDEEKNLTAYHESGHALMANLLPKADPVHKVTIIPRGRALGLTSQLPIDEKHNYSKSHIEARLYVLLGGRAAEKLIFNELSTGASNDIEIATELARKMVCEWGMSDALGPLSFGKKGEEIFLGREIQTHRDYSEKTAQTIDQEVTKIVMDAENKSNELLKDNIDILNRIANELIEHETLTGNEIDKIIAGKKLRKRRRTKNSSNSNHGRKNVSKSRAKQVKKEVEEVKLQESINLK